MHSAYYHSKGNFWQRTFGGNDKIALTSTITYQSSSRRIEAKSIVDKRSVKANRNHHLGLARLIALKVPATADGLELKIELTAVKDDSFENGIDLMNSKEFQEPLQLSSIPVGQILNVTKVIKKIFTGVENPSILESTYAGVISNEQVAEPIESERLTAGYLVIIANNKEDDDFLSTIEEKDLSIEGDGLKYRGKTCQHTNLVFSITYESLKGPEESSNWFKKYRTALNKLDDIVFSSNEDEKKQVLAQSRKLWVEGNALLFEDETYVDKEKASLKATYFGKINNRYKELTNESDSKFLSFYVEKKLENVDFITNLKTFDAKVISAKADSISSSYLKELAKNNIVMPE